jgi:hypothetical protein
LDPCFESEASEIKNILGENGPKKLKKSRKMAKSDKSTLFTQIRHLTALISFFFERNCA